MSKPSVGMYGSADEFRKRVTKKKVGEARIYDPMPSADALEGLDAEEKLGDISEEELDKALADFVDAYPKGEAAADAVTFASARGKGAATRQAVALESIAESLKRLADKLAPTPKRPPIIPPEDVLQPRRPQP